MRRVAASVGMAASVLLACACGSNPPFAASNADGERATAPVGVAPTATAPDVVGLTEGEAARALAAAGLVLNVRHHDDAPRTGLVLRSDPAAGTGVRAGSVVLAELAHPPRLPMPRPEQESEIRPLSALVARHPDVFVGLYRGIDGAPHVVFGPGAAPEEWRARLDEAAARLTYPSPGIGYRMDTCPRTHEQLRDIQDEIAADQTWHDRQEMAFGVWVQPETCTVRMESDLLRAPEIAELVDRYGPAISFDTTPGSHPRPTPRTDG